MSVHLRKSLFASPKPDLTLEDCEFYHTVEIPGHGLRHGDWDLRNTVDVYLGNFPFFGKRVLEIGPASGFLTFEMEKRGADVVCLEVPDEPGWDFVPYPPERMAVILRERAEHMRRIKNSFWFMHRLHKSRAKLCYCDSSHLPQELGHFDVAVIACVLLHCESPVRVLAECGKRADTLIITEVFHPDIEGSPICRLVPDVDGFRWDTWWNFSTMFFEQYLRVLGFGRVTITRHEQAGRYASATPMFTVVALRGP